MASVGSPQQNTLTWIALGDTSRQPAVVLLHGGPGLPGYLDDLAPWPRTSRIFKAHLTRELYRYDQRGTGQSPWRGPHSVARHVDDLAELLDPISLCRTGTLTEEPKLMWTLVVLIPHAGQWRTLAFLPYEHRSGDAWVDYAIANITYRARSPPEGRRRDALLARLVDGALYDLYDLYDLGGHAGTATGYVLHTSGSDARSIWPLLANRRPEVEAGRRRGS